MALNEIFLNFDLFFLLLLWEEQNDEKKWMVFVCGGKGRIALCGRSFWPGDDIETKGKMCLSSP